MKVGILGAGAYGTALATIAYENGCEVTIWTRDEKEKNDLELTRVNIKLPSITIPGGIAFTDNIYNVINNKDLIIFAVPVGAISSVCKLITNIEKSVICIASKGIEQNSCLFAYDIIAKHFNNDDIAVISGPSFAIDVANREPVGLSLATQSSKAESIIKSVLCNSHFKLRTTPDIIGTEICGAIKNIIAIASGMLDGLGMSESTKATFITESLHDIKQLIKLLGGQGETVLSFAGFGDLLLTATCEKSRNFSFGQLIGSGASEVEVNNYINNNTIEGLYTLKAIYKLLNDNNLNMPIITLIYNIIYKNENCSNLLKFLIEKS